MISSIIVLIKILLISSAVFYCIKKNFGELIGVKTIVAWRTIYFASTSVVLLAPSLSALLALLFLIILSLHTNSVNKVSTYFLLLFLMPIFVYQTPIININYLTIIGIILLVPLLYNQNNAQKYYRRFVDYIFIAYLYLIFILKFRGLYVSNFYGDYLSLPTLVKYGVGMFLEIFLPYFAITRYVKNMDQMKSVLIAFVTVGCIMSSIAIFETASGASLYAILSNTLGVNITPLYRGGLLRAPASTEHALVLGCILVVIFCLYNYISIYSQNNIYRLIVYLLLGGGLIATLSRGPWLATGVSIVIFYIFGKHKLTKALQFIFALIILVLIASQLGLLDSLLKFLPFVSTKAVDGETIDYRYKLFNQSLIIIQENPWFGVFDPRTHEAMLPMIQGQGIVDIVNVYLAITLETGLVGLMLFTCFSIILICKLLFLLFTYRDKDDEVYKCGVALFAGFVCYLIVLFGGPNVRIIEIVFFNLSALIIAYLNIVRLKKLENSVFVLKKSQVRKYKH